MLHCFRMSVVCLYDLLISSMTSLQIRYAFELLTDNLWKRDYDIYGIDEQHVST